MNYVASGSQSFSNINVHAIGLDYTHPWLTFSCTATFKARKSFTLAMNDFPTSIMTPLHKQDREFLLPTINNMESPGLPWCKQYWKFSMEVLFKVFQTFHYK